MERCTLLNLTGSTDKFTQRIEKKFFIDSLSLKGIEAEIVKHGFNPIFKERIIKSLYYDTTDFKCYKESSEGVVPRKKYRIRSYDKKNYYQLEVKSQQIDGRYKKTTPINEYSNKLFDKEYGMLEKKLFTEYKRKYFSNSYLRLTLDFEIKFEKLSRQKVIFGNKFLIELKPISEYSAQSQQLAENMFNTPEVSFSKYEKAVERLFLK
jgi:hypothetical protein